MNLDRLAIKYGTDKASLYNNYTEAYELELSTQKGTYNTILELGVLKGNSLLMWKEYFPQKSKIIGVDILNSVTPNIVDNVSVFLEIGDQANQQFLNSLATKYGKFDVIIDDASHLATKTVQSFNYLFPLLNSGGVYVIEDLGVFNPNSPLYGQHVDTLDGTTPIDFLANLSKSIMAGNNPAVSKMSFHKWMCFIHKK